MADNFKFSGFPDNEEFEVPDEKPRTKIGMSGMGAMKPPSLEELKNLTEDDMNHIISSLPPELKKFMKAAGIDTSSLAQQMGGLIAAMDEGDFNAMLSMIDADSSSCGECDACGNSAEDDGNFSMFPTGEPKFLLPDDFGSIECYASDDLYEEFVARYGTDSTLYLDDNIGIRDFILNDITSTLNFDEIKNMRFVNSNKYFILFYMEPKNEHDYGYYAAVVKRGENNFALHIPTYCNTFAVDEDENDLVTYLFNDEDESYMFNGLATDLTSFKFLAANLIEFSVFYALSPVHNTLITPRQFGTMRPLRASISGDSRFLPIAKITSNGSTQSILLLKDAELPLDKESYTLFMKFPNVVDEHMLRFLSDIFFNIDFNQCELLNNVELRYTSDGKLYFEVEHIENL